MKGSNCPLPLLIFVWRHIIWGASALLHTQRQKQTLPFQLKFSDTTEVSRLGIWAGQADEPPWSYKWCPWKRAERLWPHPSWWGSASPVSWNMTLKVPRCSTLTGRKSCLNLNVFDDTIRHIKLQHNYYRKLLFQLFKQNFITSVHLKAWNKATRFRLSQFT